MVCHMQVDALSVEHPHGKRTGSKSGFKRVYMCVGGWMMEGGCKKKQRPIYGDGKYNLLGLEERG